MANRLCLSFGLSFYGIREELLCSYHTKNGCFVSLIILKMVGIVFTELVIYYFCS